MLSVGVVAAGAQPRKIADTKPRVLVFYSEHTEGDHVDFAHQANTFFGARNAAATYDWIPTTNWSDLNAQELARTSVVVWLNDEPTTPAQKRAFENYMEHGGGWLGFHVSAFNDRDTDWPWFVQFLGGAVFFGNNWPPLPADLRKDDALSPILGDLPDNFRSPANEWYSWLPDPRDNKDVRVLLSLETSNYPSGLKDVLTGGDIPVAWTNTRYHMLYLNMGHGDHIFDSQQQNRMFRRALDALIAKSPVYSDRPGCNDPQHERGQDTER